MSAEDKSLESACEQPGPLAAPASPAATDRRPRGRPRKDGARKKPRSRGKSALEDEDSMDGLGAAEPENSADKDPKDLQPAEDGAQTETASVAQLTPPLQRSLSEESERSTVSVGIEAKTSEQLCAFCYCGERSLLGQGELKQFSPTPGYILPWTNPSQSGDTEDHGGACKIPGRSGRQRTQKKAKSPQSSVVCTSVSTQTDEPTFKFWDELGQVGLPADFNVQALFESTGHCWAHHRCAEWSPGVSPCEDGGLVNVDKAVVSGSRERCAYCKHLGATIKCCEEMCSQTYHYPCAAGAGAFQDLACLSLLCPEHIDQALERSKDDANCAVCDSSGDLLDQLFCTTCGQHYHGICLDIAVTPLKRAGWQCPDCKICQNCKHSGDDNKMLVCDTCDKGYHTFCLQPVMDSVPTNGWKCKNCRICVECGTRTSNLWHLNCLICDGCFQLHGNTLCQLCDKPCQLDLHKDTLHCQMCKRWIHLDCEKCSETDVDDHLKEEFVCTLCKQHLEVEDDAGGGCIVMDYAESSHVCTGEMDVDTGEKNTFQDEALNHDKIVPDDATIGINEGTPPHADEGDSEGDVVQSADPEEDMDTSHPASVHLVREISLESAGSEDGASQPLHLLEEPNEHLPLAGTSPIKDQNEPQVTAPALGGSAKATTPPLAETKGNPCSRLEAHFVCDRAFEHVSLKKDEAFSSDAADLLEMETTPTSETFTASSSPMGDKILKSPLTLDSPVTSVDTSKTSVSSSPAVSVDFHSSSDIFQSHTPAHSFSTAMSTTFISVTPKIGMGKPAITKRKFSPGRPRSRQGAWITNNTVSPPSWSPDGSEGWDIFKSRPLLGNPLWSIKVGRGSGFPAKRRPRGSGLSGRGGRGRAKLKAAYGNYILPGVTTVDVSSYREEEETSMHNTVVLFSTCDKFTLHQDMCVVCGSFGQGAEGRLLACCQCGQCYHPYCVSIKITKVILRKGWRCLECTVCEACGKATDPGRLLLCDDCDISYHTYCLDPPLQTVPKGGWKCKWCVSCTNCKAITPGLRCEWQNNYTQCAPCASLSTCPVCSLHYLEGDLILQCRQCDRWSHGSCQNLNSEVEVEMAADGGFDCAMCKPFGSPPREDCESPIDAQIVPKTRDPDPLKTFTQDGVCLTESGLSQLQSLTITVARRKRSKPKLKLKIINQNSVAVLQTPPDPQSEHSRDGEMDDSREADLMECDVKSDSSPEREPLDDDIKSVETIDMKKRKRKPYRPGIGGFMVRQRSRTGQGKAKRSLCRKDSSGSVSELLPGREESWSELVPEINADESVPGCDGTDKIKKRYRKKKNKLEETFPAYLQEAFFGRNLLDTSKQNKTSMENFSEDSAQTLFKVNANSSFLDPSSDPLLSSAAPLTPSKRNEGGCRPPVSLADLSEVLNTDDDLLGILSDDLAKATHQSGLDMSTMSDDSSSLPQTSVTQHSSRPLSEDQLDGILSPELDKMVTDGAILGKLYKIPELEGKDVEDLFTAVLSPVATHPSSMPQPLPPSAPSHPHHPHTPLLPLHNQGDGLFSRMPLNGIMPRNAHLQHNPLVPGRGLGTFSPLNQLPYTDNRDKNLLYHGMTNDPGSTWNSQPPIMESEGDTMSNAQRSTLKWEKEEALGEMATVAPVLYTNVNFPNLKDEFPDWSTRVKQIAKLWRKASSQERAPYVQKARDNRAALRINKVQMSNDSLKRQPQDVIDQSSRIDSDLFKDPLRQRESEHEQEWKYRQQMRQKSKQQAKIEATQKLEQVKNEQQQQQQQQQFGSQHHLSQSGSDTPNSGAQSPLTPQQSSGSISPLQQSYSKDGFPKHSLPGTPSYSDDVFLKPQAPPPTPTRLQLQDPLQLSQPHSPQMFSPGSSRSTSPVDPYAKMVGTPRPPPTGQGYMRRNSGSPMDICPSRLFISSDGADNRQSPVGDPCSSPSGMDSHRSLMTSEPFSKPVTLMRMPPNADLLGDGSLVPGNGDPFTKFSPRSEKLQRQPALPSKMTDPYSRPPLTPTHGVAEGSPAPFKTPMRPPQSPQDSYSSMPATSRRLSADPYDRPVMTPRPENVPHDVYSQTAPMGCSGLNDSFAHPPRFMRQHSDPTSQPTFQPRPTAQDPYAQPPGTPRPVTNPYLQSPTAQRPVDPYLQQPSRPTAQPYDPYSQQPSTPRPNMGDVFVQPSLSKRHHDIFAQSSGVPRPVMDPCSQQPRVPRPLSLDPYSQPPGTPRPGPSDSYSQAPGTPKQILSDPYSQPPGTPRPVPSDPYSQPPGTPRPVPSDPYSQPPGTQRLVTSDPYSQPPGTPRPVPSDPYSQPPGTPRPVPSDPYSQPPGTPRPVPSDPYSQPPGTPRPVPSDPYSQPPGTPRPVINDPYLHPSRMPRPVLSDPYAQPPRTPMPGIPDHLNRPPVVRTGLTLNQDAFLQAAPNRGPPLQSHFMRPSDPNLQTLRPLGPGSMDGFAHSSGGPVHDPYDQPPRTPRMPVVDAFGDGHDIAEQRSLSEDHFSMPSSVPPSPQDQQFSNLQPGLVLGVPDAQNSLAETEEKIRQRLKLREHLLRQQQQKIAVRQEKAAMDPQQMTQGGHPAQWQQDNLHRSPEMFNRPPPPYPGSIRPPLGPKGSPRFAVFPQEQQASFPGNGQFNRPPFTGDMSNMGMRPPPGHRFAYSLGGPVMGHERYLGPPLPMQVPGASQQMRRDMAIELTRPSNNSQMANSVSLPPHFPHQGIQVQQHNISGQAYIELRHRPPDGRPRILYGPSPNLMDPASHHPRHGGYFIRPGFQGQRLMDPTRVPHPGLPNQMQMAPNLEHFMQSQQGQMNAEHQSVLLMRGMGQPLNNDLFLLAPFSTMDSNEEASGLSIGNPSSSGMEDKLDQDDPSEKDLDVKDLVSDEVKDLDDFENINLDPDDGKGDELDGLDNLDTNDPHLDDLLRSGKFDIIAYTDPEHDLEDKKDLFNDDLELGETIDDKLDLQCPNEDAKVQEEPEIKAALPVMNSPNQAAGLPRQIKTELISPNSADQSVSEIQCDRNVEASSAQQHGEVTSVSPGNGERSGTVEQLCIPNPNMAEDPSQASVQDALSSSVLRESSPVLTDLLSNDKPANSEVEALGSPSGAMPPALPDSLAVTQTAAATSGQILDHSLNPNLGASLNHDFSQGSPTNPDFVTGQQGGHSFDDVEQSSQAMQLANQQCPGGLSGAQQGMLSQNRERPLLLEEQPLLLQDLLDQERQEQQQQRQMQAMIRQRSETCFPNIDFDAITDPIMKAKMVALKGINKVMAQNNMGMPQMVMTRFPFMTPQITGAQPVEGPNIVQQAIAPDGGIPPQMIRPNPLNFGHGFVNDSQKQQYEEWLKETQQLLQIQQKFLEEQIGVHRKSKKALSAKQRTAKKAGREFPEEDAEQLKNVTEQQSMVQKQLEQIRKQQKEHTELIEEYRNKQHTQFSVTPLVPGAPPPQALMPVVPPPSLNQQSFPVPQPLHSGGPLLPGQTRMPAIPNWQPPNAPTASVPMNAPRMQHPVNADAPGPAGPNANPNAPPRVEFDDNNPFSETFQERERKERLREQQERQRIQLMQEVDRQRALQRLEMEKHGLGGADLDSRSLQQMPFFPSELPVDFLQSPQPQGSPPAAPFNQTPERRPLDQSPFKSEAIPGETQLHAVKQSPENTSGPEFTPTQPRPSFMSSVPSSSPAADDTSSSSQNFSAISALSYQGPSQSLIQVYSEIIPEEKGKKKRTRKKKKEEEAESVMSPSTPRSDTTAPLTPSLSDASTPVVGIPNDVTFQEEHAADLIRSSTPKFSGKTSLDLEDALLPAGAKQRLFEEPGPGQDEGPCPTKDVLKIHHIKMEQTEDHQTPEHSEDKTSHSVRLKNEDDKSSSHNALSAEVPPHTASGPSGNELLKHLLKNKKQPLLMHQKSEERMRPEEDCSVEMKLPDRPGQLNTLHVSETKGPQAGFKANQSVLQRADFEMDKKKPRNKRIQKTVEKATPRSKKRKKEEEQKPSIYNSETFTHIKQLSLLPLIEPIVGMNFAQFLPYGTGTISAGSRLLGTFGAASLEGVSDYYSQLIFKQNNLSNPPTPPASLPPTPPPVACQKLVNGYATTEELAGKAAILGGHVTKALGPKPFQLPFRSQEDLLARAMTQGPKSVDVPASLPTPPHNNQEELRVQDHCDARDSPDSFVPSSSPESVVGMEISRYPDLSLVKEEPPDPAPSPIIPMLPSSTGKGSEARDFGMKREPPSVFFGSQFVQVPNGPKSGLISVAITLHPTAAENINGVMAAFADLLQVRMPTSYEVSGASEAPSMILMNGHRINSNVDYRTMSLLRARQGSIPPARMIGSYGMRPQNLPFMPNSNGVPAYKHHNPRVRDCPVRKDSWCCHCKVVVLGIGVRKSLKDLSFLKQEFLQSPGRVEGDMVFCSNNCFLLFSAAQTKHTESKDRSVTPPSFKEAQVKSCHQYSNNTSTIDVHCLPLLQEKSSPPMSPPISFPPATFETAKVEAKPDELKVTVKLKPRPRAIHGLMDDSRHPGKKWKGMKWKKWNIQFVIPKMPFRTQCEGNIDDFLRRLGTSLRPDPLPKDFRKCCFCHEEGDGVTDGPARLLNLDLDLWVHLNCALWSTEVYETQAGALINVELALRRGLQMKCVFCHKTGATSGCHRLRCTSIYHFTCAIKAQCMFFKDKTMLCPMHKPKGAHEQELTYFAVFRRVYVQRDEVRQIASIVQRGERDHTFRVGSLIFHAIGQLLPHQMQDFHSVSALFPVGYEASRLYWSIRYANKRCRYLCSIEEKDGFPLFVIRVIEPGHEDILLMDSTPKGVWDKILEPVANCRKDSEILRLFPVYLKGEDLFGLTVSAVTRIAESLPGVEACENYTFRFGRNPLMELPLAINPSGSARSEPKMSSHVKRFVLRPHTLNSTSTSKSFQSTVTGELNAPYSKQFVHSKSSQYRKMKTEWKSNVYLARSRIQGLGLYAARDIEKHTMVIEYIGTIIRNEVANRKEKLYESQNRGVYMFRMDNEHVIDATLTGGPARYINHSCAPNCVAEMVTFEKGHKIIISSSRRIQKGEELCYDYKFDFEDDQHKIPCHCRAVNCRKWMN